MRRRGTICLAASLVAGCTSGSLNNALGTPKNPTPVFADPDPNARYKDDQSVFIRADYGVLLEAIQFPKPVTASDPTAKNASEIKSLTIVTKGNASTAEIRRYLAAGFNLSNFYCKRFLNKTDEAYRRRRYARSLGNDVGTAVTTVLGLANAGEAAVSALAAATGVVDSALRNYDDSFLITPELGTVKGLLRAAQANFRAQYLGLEGVLPSDYDTAQSVIQDYADLCSFQGMKELLTISASQQQSTLKTATEKLVKPRAVADGGSDEPAGAEPTPADNDAPAVADPPLASNAPSP